MGLIDQIKQDIKQITGDASGFGVELVFTAPDTTTATITGLFTKHHLGIDNDTGRPVNSRNVHCSFSEDLLLDEEYPVRNAAGEVSLAGHKVTCTDSTGTSGTYVITEWFPDETIGLIVCILGDFE